MILKEIKVGDHVIECAQCLTAQGLSVDSPICVRVVKRVLVRFIELNDGSKWLPDGSGEYPRVGWNHFCLVNYTKDLENEILVSQLTRELRNANYDGYSLKALREIKELIKKSSPLFCENKK